MSTEVSLFGGDINDVDADFVVVPVDARLACDRAAARAVLDACDDDVRQSLKRLKDVVPSGIAPGAVVVLPARGHRRFVAVVFVVVIDNRRDVDSKRVEPDDERIAAAARALWQVLDDEGAGSVAVASLAGRNVDGGEAAATVVRAREGVGARDRRIVFVDRDAITLKDMGAAIESIGVSVLTAATH